MHYEKAWIVAGAIFVLALIFQNGLKAQQGNGPGHGQAGGQGMIIGTVSDEKTGEAVEYANVVLYKTKDSTMINGAVTDKKGYFRFEKINPGNYYLKINFIGYKTGEIFDIALSPDLVIKDIGEIILKPSSTNIEGVTINGDKEQMEFNLDKRVINVDKNLVLTGGTAIDIMQTIPSVQVDVEGTVSLRGSSNVTILIDGRPSGFTSLDQLPASMVERVEIVTNPSARYDPDGMSGIINIVLKKKKEPGYNGMVSLNMGTHDKYMGSVNLNYRYNKINVFANYDIRYFSMNGNTINNRESWMNDTSSYLYQFNDSRRHGKFHNIKAGIDYFINDFNTFSISGLYHLRSFESNDLYQYTESDYLHSLTDYYERFSDGLYHTDGYEVATAYKKTFQEKGREWTIDASMEVHDSRAGQDMHTQDYDLNMAWESPATFQQSVTTDRNYEGQFRTDYVHPIGKGRLETGYKYDIENSDQDYVLSDLNGAGTEWITDTNTSNRFVYNEQIHAAYVIYSNSLKKFQYQAGVRFEEDLSKADQVTQDITFHRDRFSWYPSVHLKYEFSDMHAIQLSYSRRIHRPRTRYLNPFTNYSDPLFLSTGNPYLKPEYIDAAEFAYDFSYKGTNITASIFYRQINDMITRTTILDTSGISYTTYDNLNNGRSYGVELIYAQKLFKWWKINLNGSYYRQEYDGDQISIENETSYSWNAKFNSVWSPIKGFDIQASFIYNSPMVSASGTSDRFFSGSSSQGKLSENYWADLGMKKDFLKGALSLSFRIADVFKTQKYDMYSWGDNYTTYTERHRDSRIIFLGISYKLNGGGKKKRPEDMDNIELDM